MHAYASDSDERIRVPLYLGFLAAFAAWGISEVLRGFDLDLPWWIGPPSALTLFGYFFWLFDRSAWRWAWLRTATRLKTPDLAGTWRGEVEPEGDGQGRATPVEVTIDQKWSSISIGLSTAESTSRSEMASLFCSSPKAILSYQYLSEPRPGASKTMEIHRGTVRLELVEPDVLEGSYYTGRGRRTVGRLMLRLEESA